jgi:hypothetical protein
VCDPYRLNEWTTLTLTKCHKTPQDPVGVEVGVSSKKARVLTEHKFLKIISLLDDQCDQCATILYVV